MHERCHLELRPRLGIRRRCDAGSAGDRSGRRGLGLGPRGCGSGCAGRRADRGRAAAAVQGCGLHDQSPGIPGILLRRLQGRTGPAQHQLPLYVGGARLPPRQCRCRGGGVPCPVCFGDRGYPRPVRRGEDLGGGRLRRQLPRLGHAVGTTDRRNAGRSTLSRALGPRPGRFHDDLHRWNHGYAQGRDVAAGGSDRPIQLHGQSAAGHRSAGKARRCG